MTPVWVVFDTNILVSALLSPLGNPAIIYKMFMDETIKPVYSFEILAEYQDVLNRPRLHLPAAAVQKVLAAVQEHGMIVEPNRSAFAMIDDDDRFFYDAARSAGAYLVTGNMRHYPNEAFIMTPMEFLCFFKQGCEKHG